MAGKKVLYDQPVEATCPWIDDVITKLAHIDEVGNTIYEEVKNMSGGDPDCEDTINALLVDIRAIIDDSDLKYEMEVIREANSELRSWGESLVEECQDLDDKIDDLEVAVEDLEEAHNGLEGVVTDYQGELSVAERRIRELELQLEEMQSRGTE